VLTVRTAGAALPRVGTRASQLTRLLWLAALLFGLLFAHGLHGESTAGHLEAGVTASLPVDGSESSADHDHGQREDGESTDSAHNCAPGQPDDVVHVPPPDASPLEVTDLCGPAPLSVRRAVITSPSAGSPHATSVLRI